jgi:hypothetical protein
LLASTRIVTTLYEAGAADGRIAKAKDRDERFGRKPLLLPQTVEQIKVMRETGERVPTFMRQTGLSKASVYRALDAGWLKAAY